MRKRYEDYMKASTDAATSASKLNADIHEMGELDAINTEEKQIVADACSELLGHALHTESNAVLWAIGAELSGIADELRIANTPSPVKSGLLTTGQRVALANARSHLNEALTVTEAGVRFGGRDAIGRAIAALEAI